MKAPPFDYVLAESVADVHGALTDARRSSLEPKVLAGGQSLVPLMNFRLARPDRLVDINRIEALDYLEVEDSVVRMGALCRHADVERHGSLMSRVGALADALPLIGHPSIRSRGTVVGSLAHGDPLAEWISLALLLDATITLSSESQIRVVEAADWLQGYLSTAANSDELVQEAAFALPSRDRSREGSAFVELARRHGDFCLVSAAASVTISVEGRIERARLVIAGAGTVPFRCEAAEETLVGELPADEAFQRAVERLGDLEAQSDLHATAAYRRRAAAVVAFRALRSAGSRATREAA